MSLLERVLRVAASEPSTPDTASQWWRPALHGALSASASWLVLTVPALLAWVASARSTVEWGRALGVGSALWFLANGMPVTVDSATVSVVPLGLWGLSVAVTTRLLWRILQATEAAAKGTTWPALVATRLLPGFFAGYAAAAVGAWLLCLAGSARPVALGIGGVLGVPLLATGVCALRRYAGGGAPAALAEPLDRLPRWLHRAVRPGLWGTALLGGLGTVLVLVMLVTRFPAVAALHGALDTGAVGGALLVLAQLLFLPNLVTWALAWLAGPGFSVAQGSSITLTSAHPGLMPMVPVLAALPSEATYPAWLRVVVLVPVAVGAVVGWRACRGLARLSSWRTKLATAATAATLCALAVGLLAALGSGSAGVARLEQVGPDAGALTGALLAELLVGAAAYVLLDVVRQRRR